MRPELPTGTQMQGIRRRVNQPEADYVIFGRNEVAQLLQLIDYLGNPDGLRIDGTWIVREVDYCNCAGGTIESSGAHEPYCGMEPELDLTQLKGWEQMTTRIKRVDGLPVAVAKGEPYDFEIGGVGTIRWGDEGKRYHLRDDAGPLVEVWEPEPGKPDPWETVGTTAEGHPVSVRPIDDPGAKPDPFCSDLGCGLLAGHAGDHLPPF